MLKMKESWYGGPVLPRPINRRRLQNANFPFATPAECWPIKQLQNRIAVPQAPQVSRLRLVVTICRFVKHPPRIATDFQFLSKNGTTARYRITFYFQFYFLLTPQRQQRETKGFWFYQDNNSTIQTIQRHVKFLSPINDLRKARYVGSVNFYL